MKLRTLTFPVERFVEFLQGKPCTFTSNLPNDTELLDIKMELLSRQITLIIRSDTFEDIPDNFPLPEFNTATITNNSASSTLNPICSVQNIEPKPIYTPPQPAPLTLKPPPHSPSRYAAKMENEFSSDQRKLLSFTIKENCVIVKPVTFLKAEWEDINETVRSLGGRWVKGDIISYWEIPLQ
ncbi:MAG: hypothetical protein LBQ98_02210 [Nitrososphaerota archaeon]|jgi:hypothetical protein|nr:hypothetical protein [Nitrososphaerota archaeon]